MSGQVLRDTVFHGMSLCQAMWPLEMARDAHLTGIGICYDGTNMRHNHIHAGVMTYIFHRPNKKHDAFGNIEYEQSKESGPSVYAQ